MTWHPLRNATLVLILGVLSYGGSCVSDSSGPYNSSGGSTNDDNWNHTRPDDDSDRPHRIPRNADIVREGVGKLKWTADLDGVIYVYDHEQDSIRYTGPVHRGVEIVVQPKDDAVLLDGRNVSNEDLRRDDTHQLYFAATNGRPYRDRDHGNDAPPPPPSPPPVRDHGPDGIPDGSTQLDHGTGDLSLSRAAHNGTVYIYDETARSVLYQGSIRKGSALQFNAREGRIYIDGQAGNRVKFTKGHTQSLYFLNK